MVVLTGYGLVTLRWCGCTGAESGGFIVKPIGGSDPKRVVAIALDFTSAALKFLWLPLMRPC
jgi:hypothetical protein